MLRILERRSTKTALAVPDCKSRAPLVVASGNALCISFARSGVPVAKKLKGFENRYRIRIGDYCVIYEVHDDVLLLIIVKVGSRRDIY